MTDAERVSQILDIPEHTVIALSDAEPEEVRDLVGNYADTRREQEAALQYFGVEPRRQR